MRILVKIGTMPPTTVKVCRKRRLPVVGDFIKVKRIDDKHKEIGLYVDDVKDIDGIGKLFFAELM